MRKSKVIDIVFILLSAAVLALMIVFFNTEEGKVSETEARKLAGKPISPFYTAEFRTETENYINDNIGLRGGLLKLRAMLSLNLYGTSTESLSQGKVVEGKNGFYFCTLDHNLEITTGGYPMTDEILKNIAKTQQTISDHYKVKGIDYVLVLTPSKVSAYPEYLNGDYTVGTTVIDIVYDYLKEHTDVKVVNAKNNVIAHKDEGMLFWKTDTHFTQLGAYYEYEAIANVLESENICDIRKFDISTDGTQDVSGEFSRMLGVDGILGTEIAETVTWENTSELIKNGEYQEKLYDISIKNGMNSKYTVDIYRNSSVDAPRLLIYGDSQFMKARQIPELLSESFSEVVMTRLRYFSDELEGEAKPDVVVFTMVERYLETLPNYCPFAVPADEVSAPEMSAETDEMTLYIDTCNKAKPESRSALKIRADSSAVSIEGWAADESRTAILDKLYACVDGRYYEAKYGNARTSVANYYNSDSMLNSGFKITLNIDSFKTSEGAYADEISFIGVMPDGTCTNPVLFSVDIS